MSTPFISIITACYNSSATIKDTIESVLDQTYHNIEYILIDGDSEDNTVSIIKSYKEFFKLKGINYRWISEKDNGIYDAMNKGLSLVHGEWIVFIGSDDYYKNNKVLENTISNLNHAKSNNIKYVYGKIEHVNNKKELIEISGEPWQKQKERFPYIMNINHSGSFHHKTLFTIHGKFNDTFKIAGDYEFLLRELKNEVNNALFIENILIIMREGGISSTLSNRLNLVRESQKARKINKINSFSKELTYWKLRVRIILIISFLFGDKCSSILADFYRKVILGKQKRWTN